MTALPLFGTTSDPGTLLNGPDQRGRIVRALSASYEIVPLAHIEAKSLKGRTLILAQPRGLAGEELVAIDTWVREGGRAAIFTDPELVWPSELPLGDPRRAPPVSLLDPLLGHWGLTLASTTIAESGPERRIVIERSTVAVARAGRWQAKSRDCILESDGLIADCRIGKGRALLVADADLLDERLWEVSGADNESAILALIARVATVR